MMASFIINALAFFQVGGPLGGTPIVASPRALPPHSVVLRPRSIFGEIAIHIPAPSELFSAGATFDMPAKEEKRSTKVDELMTKDVVTLTPGMELSAAACKLAEYGISGAPVVDDEGFLVGVLSQRDLLYSSSGRNRVRFLTDGPRSERHVVNTQRMRKVLEGDVASIMSARATTIRPDATIKEAAKTLLDRHINRVPVVDDKGTLVGMLTTSDIMAVATQSEFGCQIFE
jgi:CBS domain-containing protein